MQARLQSAQMFKSLISRSSGSGGGSHRRNKSSKSVKDEELKQLQLENSQAMQRLTQMVEEKNKEREAAVEREERREAMMLEEEGREKDRRKGIIMDKTEQGVEKFDLNLDTMGLVDRLEAHPAGKLLKNVVISNEPPPDRELNIHRLRRFKPQNDFAKMTLSSIPAIRLSSELMELSIVEAMTETQFRDLKAYVLVSDVFIHYIPLDSFFSQSSPVNFQLNDFRKTDNTVMREYPLTHSGGYNILMTLDYCVAKEDLKHLSLSISTSLSSFRRDVAWASCKVLLTVSHMDFPVKANIQETMGVLHLADSDLTDFISDPRSSDGVITPQAMTLLRGHYKRGEIENINNPRDDKKEVNTAKTIVGESQGDVDVRDLMADLRQQGLAKARTGLPDGPPKSAMKKPPATPLFYQEQHGGDRDGLDSLSDVAFGESRSNEGSEGTVELPVRKASVPPSTRSVNF